jgi:gamma-glutamylcyclotransferase (GGCT)/AIG2-like uncharacterized protein YtfP
MRAGWRVAKGIGRARSGFGRPATLAAMTPPPIIAVYGTLRRGEPNASLLSGARDLGVGRVAGRLHEMPRTVERAYAYPALVLDGGGDGEVVSAVVVEVYELADQATLAVIDALEAFDPDDVAGSEYVRRLVGILDGPVATAWIYTYNGPPEAMGDRIPDGDWVAHRARTSGQRV